MFAAGVISYLDPEGGIRGLESVCLRRYRDGVRELYAKTSIFDVGVERAVILRVDGRWRPLWCRVNTWQPGQPPESMEITVRADLGWTDIEQWGGVIDGRRRTRLDVVPNAIGAHPVAGDCWSLPPAGLTEPGSSATVTSILMTTVDPRGGVPMQPTVRAEQYVHYLGPDTITVAAGTFAVRVFELGVAGRPPERIAVQGEEFGLVRLEHPYLRARYELTSWTHSPLGGQAVGPLSTDA